MKQKKVASRNYDLKENMNLYKLNIGKIRNDGKEHSSYKWYTWTSYISYTRIDDDVIP